jgi:type I restriction enzyme, S subunit
MSEVVVPDGWEVRKSYEIFEFINGKAFYSDGYSGGGYRVIDLLNINLDGKFQLTVKDKYIPLITYEKYPKSHLQKDDLIIIMTDITPTLGLIGKTAIIDRNFAYVLNQRVGCLRVLMQGEVSIPFMNNMFNSSIVRLQVIKNTLGTAQYYINTPEIKKLSIPLPPLPEQQKIASILTSVDEVIEKTQSQINKLQDMKKGTMNELLTKGIGHTEFKDSPVGKIPKGWEVVELKENLSFISYGFTNPMSESEVGPLMITARDIVDGRIVIETARKTTYKEYNELLTDKSRPQLGDILLTKDGTLGRIAIVDCEGVCINQSVAVLRPNNTVDRKFLYHLLISPFYQKEMLDKAGGSTIKHIYITVVDKMKVVSPPLPEQQKIASILSSMDSYIEEKQRKLEQTQSLKKSLMQDLLTGKVRVTVH